ncbi:MAG: hypothetical protein Q8O33_04490 [Pseudomonadota bacterium]|nr:hypothetical protein [Pseudomonadota bacterium]
MPAKKYLSHASGRIQEVAATVTSTGAGDDGKIVALDATGRLDASIMPVGLGADTASIVASENLAAGDYVNIWDSTGAKVRKADAATAGKEAVGFVLAAVTSGQSATVYFEGQNTQKTGLTPGSRQYLSAATPGATAATAPSATGNVVQLLGVAVSSTSISTEIEDGIVLA